tara:strand:+ start:518 stop:1915 length:1398 start_codon:yes stop_codon:yes gene_type:complete
LYNTYFATIWLTNVLAIPVVVAMVIWAIGWHWVPERLAIGLIDAAVGLVWIIYLRLHGPRVLMRAGAWPALCTGDYFPRTEEALVAAVTAVVNETGQPPVVVGSGWGFFLYRKGPKGRRIFLHNYKGLVPGTQRWRAGTTIAQANLFLKKKGYTFATHPTMDYISLGSWFACSNHGNGGATAGKSSDALKNARVLNMAAGTIETLEYPEIRKLFDGKEAFKYCIIDCEFAQDKLAQNSDVQKRGIKVDSPESAAVWLDPTQHLRLLFMGAARDHGIGIQWGPLYDASEYGGVHGHRDPHCCQRWCSFFQVDVCSVIGGCYESAYTEVDGVKYLKNFTGVTTRYHANKWMPTVAPWQTISVVLSGHRNYEIFFKLEEPLNGKTLWKLVSELIGMHKKFGGRSEIRHGAPEGAICLDMSMNKNFIAPFRILKLEMGVDTVALHPGKWNDPREIRTRPWCRRVPIGEL